MEDLKTSIVLYGSINPEKENILDWYQYANEFSRKLGFPITHIGVTGDSFESGKILMLKRAEKRFKNSLEKDASIRALELYSLPEEFTQAVFDYDIQWILETESDKPLLFISVPTNSFSEIDVDKTINHLKEFIQFRKGEIFEMSVEDSPAYYAHKMNEPEDYNSLKILKKL